MSREFKFRAFDEKSKIMHHDFKYIKSGDGSMDWIIFQSDIQQKSIAEIINNPYCAVQFKIMQYTGIQDKNGNKIYEGDIVSWITVADRYVVYYDESRCAFYLSQKRRTHENEIQLGINLSINVLGNLYENPEFLEKKQ